MAIPNATIAGDMNMYLSATSLNGTDVKNAQGENLGKVEDLMVNTTTGQVEYAVMSFGGFLGVGEKYFAVPLQAVKVDANDEKLILNESKERLKNAPGFDKDHWPNHADPKWVNEVRSYYQIAG